MNSKLAEKFAPAHPRRIENTCANIKWQVEGEPDLKTYDYDKTFSGKVSAPYVLARLCAMFRDLQIQTEGQEAYKVTWEVVLEHVETGHVVTFYDYKGGISYGSDISGDDTPKSFIADLRKLLKALSDDRFPHPYDGCAVGEVA